MVGLKIAAGDALQVAAAATDREIGIAVMPCRLAVFGGETERERLPDVFAQRDRERCPVFPDNGVGAEFVVFRFPTVPIFHTATGRRTGKVGTETRWRGYLLSALVIDTQQKLRIFINAVFIHTMPRHFQYNGIFKFHNIALPRLHGIFVLNRFCFCTDIPVSQTDGGYLTVGDGLEFVFGARVAFAFYVVDRVARLLVVVSLVYDTCMFIWFLETAIVACGLLQIHIIHTAVAGYPDKLGSTLPFGETVFAANRAHGEYVIPFGKGLQLHRILLYGIIEYYFPVLHIIVPHLIHPAAFRP